MQRISNLNDSITALRTQGDDVLSQQAIGLLTVLNGTKINPTSPTLLDDMIDARRTAPRINDYLAHVVPGMSSGYAHTEVAKTFLKMLVDTVAAAPAPLPQAA